MKTFRNYLEMATKEERNNAFGENSELLKFYKKLVPPMGQADTVEGEMVRAIMRLLRRYRNDGDYFYKGYGRETCGATAAYLRTKTPISKTLAPLLSKARGETVEQGVKRADLHQYSDDDRYLHYLTAIANEIAKYVKSKNGKYERNSVSSR